MLSEVPTLRSRDEVETYHPPHRAPMCNASAHDKFRLASEEQLLAQPDDGFYVMLSAVTKWLVTSGEPLDLHR